MYVAMKDDSDEDTTTLIFYVKKVDKWIIDSGCSHHMTGDKSKFKNFESYDGNNVNLEMMHHVLLNEGFFILIDKITCDNTYFVEWLN